VVARPNAGERKTTIKKGNNMKHFLKNPILFAVLALLTNISAVMAQQNTNNDSGGLATTAISGTSSKLPPEVDSVGIYYKNQNGTWQEMRPEIVNFKTGGTMKQIATRGIVSGDINGNIQGATGKVALRFPTEFIMYLPEGRAPEEYILLRLRTKKKEREFRALTGGVFNPSTGAKRDTVNYASTKIAPRAYAVTLNSDIGAGEYGFLPQLELEVGSLKSGKIYSFSLGN
jgi:hypothetical protein